MTGHAPDAKAAAVMQALRRRIAGEVRDDRLSRALYATDASIYQIVPDGVVIPKTIDDVIETVRLCAERGVPITPRGAATGLAGGCVNRGIQLDCSKHLNRILAIDPQARIALVEPGVVLDDLNAAAWKDGLHFAPDVATGSRATIGGMIANNSCGAHSIVFGRTVDHVVALDVVLSDGSRQSWGQTDHDELRIEHGPGPAGTAFAALNARLPIHSGGLGAECEGILRQVAAEYADEIAARFPKVMRRNGGYALDRLRVANGRVNAETIICGSEGTLAIVVGAALRLTPLPRHKGLVVAHFDDLLAALEATPATLEHAPAAVELIDHLIISAARAHPSLSRRRSVVEGNPRALLLIELHDDRADALEARLVAVADDLKRRRMGYAQPVVTDPAEQAHVWEIRKAGLGLLMSRPGDRQPYDFVEDTAVEPGRLRDYIARFMQVLAEEGVTEASYYAHASVGCLHVKPVLNLRRLADVERMYRVADRIGSLALEFGGTITGEHGDGIVRSCWLEKMYGPRIIEAFRRIKRTFDPSNIFNPGKITDPLPMTDNLRWHPRAAAPSAPAGAAAATTGGLLSVLNFSAHGGMAGLAEMCSGVGQCRQRGVGTMCPSYVATLDERHTTRGRANALRLALSGGGLLDGLSDPALDEVMDLCISCKACRTECPTGVDMARLKAEWLHARNRRRGTPLSARFVASAHRWAALGSRCPRAANATAQSAVGRWLGDKLLGLDRRIPPPRLAKQSFRHWFAARRGRSSGRDAGPEHARPVVLFVDTWTNHFAPQAGMAATAVLEALGWQVIVPETACCGRPAISKGLLDEARALAIRNADVLAPYAEAAVPIVGLEPSCVLTFSDEFPQLVRTPVARRIAAGAMMIESLLARRTSELEALLAPRRQSGATSRRCFIYHGHCHQKSLVGSGDAMALLRAVAADAAREINSGCCGMAGSFGHERAHYDVARAIGEERLFPAVRSRGDAEVVVSGFSCRQQIEHHTGASPRHVIEIVADALGIGIGAVPGIRAGS